MSRHGTKLALAAVVWVGVVSPDAVAVETRQWTAAAAELQKGESTGIAVSSRGRLFLAPKLTALASESGARREAHVWSVASDSAGNVYLGTGPEGRVVRVSPSGETRPVFQVDEPMVTALAVLPEGDILAGTAPEGKVYRIRRDGRGGVWAETGERYVWSLAAAPDGEVYVGTGEQGIIFKLGPGGEPRVFFDSDEPHVVSMVRRRRGGLLAGGAGRGLVYELDSEGNAFVLHDDGLPEVRALALAADDSVVAALLGPPEPEPRPPAVRIRLPDGVGVGAAPEQVGELDETEGATVEGVIEGLRMPGAEPRGELRGRVVRIDPDGGIREVWRSETEAPFCLALDSSGRPVFGTGEPGRLYRVDDDGEVALLASLPEAQVTGLAAAGPLLVAATSNPASAYRLDRVPTDRGTFVSRPFDAGAVARWGSIRWHADGAGGRVELYTRTGNSADPDATWSAWGPGLTDPSGGPVVNPDGRFLQWRARLLGGGEAAAGISGVTVSYAPHNRPPAIREFRLHPEADAVSADATFRWSVSDPDGDPLEVRLEHRAEGSRGWTEALRQGPDPASGSTGWRSGEATWKTEEVEEGAYEIRAVASDAAANAPGDGRETAADAVLAVVVDRSPPELSARRAAQEALEVDVSDLHSAVSRLEVVGGGRVVFRPRPEDGVCDSPRESFRIADAHLVGLPAPRLLRAVDAAGNAVEQPVPAP